MDWEAIATLATSLGTMIFIGIAILRFGPQQRQAITAGDLNEVEQMEGLVRTMQAKFEQTEAQLESRLARGEAEAARKSLRASEAQQSAVEERIRTAKVVNRMEEEVRKLHETVEDERAQRVGLEKAFTIERNKVEKLEEQLVEAKQEAGEAKEENSRLRTLYLQQSEDHDELKKGYDALKKMVDDLRAKLASYEKTNGQ